MGPPTLRRLLALVALTVTAGRGHAQGSSAYTERIFATRDGLPSQAISHVVQARDGYLWVASGGLLSRFDGVSFRSYSAANTPLLRSRVVAIAPGLGDTLWIVDQSSALLAYTGGRFVSVAPSSPGLIQAIGQDRHGSLYAVRAQTVVRLDRGRGTWTPTSQALGLSFLTAYWLTADGRGDLWIPDSASVLRRVTSPADSHPTVGQAALVSPRTGAVLSIVARNGRHEVREADGTVSWSYPARGNVPILVDRDDRLWVANDTQYVVYERGVERPVAVVRRITPLSALHLGAAGCLWETGVALRQICRSAFRSFPVPASEYNGRGPGGSIIFRRHKGGESIAISPDQPQVLLTDDEHLRYAGAFADHRDVVWWAKTSAPLASRQQRAIEITGGARVLPHRDVIAFSDDPRFPGVIWYGSGTALYRTISDGATGRVVTDSVELAGRPTSVSFASDGSAWVTLVTRDAMPGLVHVRGSTVTGYGPDNGIPPAELRVVHAMDDGSVWIGTYGAGLLRLRDGRVQRITARDGLAENVVTSFLLDERGNVWMGGNQSIHRAPLRELSDVLDGKRSHVNGVAYSEADGIEVPEATGPPGVRADKGRLWLPTINGAVLVDPRLALTLDSLAPVIRIDDLLTAHDSLGWSPTPVRLTRGARRLTVRYAGVIMRKADALRYQYRIDGVDADWIDAGRARVATYNAVGPGRHTFRVRAITAAGAATPGEATLDFIVPAFFTETPLFFVLFLSGAGALLWTGVRFRERALVRQQAALSQAVQERTAELSEALATVGDQASQLRTLDEAKSRFFANVSHEFRTPLSLILGPVDDLREGRFGTLGAAATRRLDGVRANAERLLQLVDQLLDIARLQSGALTLSARVQDLVPLLRRMTDSFSSLAERKGIDLRLSCPVSGLIVSCDADQIEKVIANLVGNALKFTPPGGAVELLASVQPGDAGAPGAVVIEVVDTGPGIAPEFQARVFDRFFQVNDSASRPHEGTGIGLALVRELVELHGGEVRLQSTVGSGSRFMVRLPLAATGVRAPAERVRLTPERVGVQRRERPQVARPRDAAVDSVTVLLVEDNADLLEYLREHLAERFRVIVAENGARGLEMARLHHPDLIVSDVMMPEMDGQALCEAIKGDPETDYIPVVLLTAKASRDSRLSGLAQGADDYLTKPVDLQELLIRAENLIASRRHVRERLRALDQPLPTIQVPLAAPPRDATERAMVDQLSRELARHLADAEFDVSALAAAMGMGRTTLYRKLSPLLGMSPLDALREYRLAQAAQWLAETAITVSEVAYGVGFKSVPHFSTSFRERFGVSPSAYRQAQGKGSASGAPAAGNVTSPPRGRA
ncbi:MAG: response regulator [Gemmatimonadetes bacterium]|nr:response regulator [Gemmatimonadota bacterium]